MMALGLNSFITTQGFATTSMLTVVIGAVINIILDPIFMFVFHMGVQGAALATILSQGVSCAWVLWFLFGKKTKLRIKKENLKLTKLIWPVLALGVSPFIMQSTESLLSICLNTSLQTYGGDIAVGSMTILTSVMQFLMLPLMGLAQGAQPIISFNYGAGNRERVGSAFKMLLICSLIFSGTLWLFCMLLPGVFVRLFTPEPALVEAASWALRIYFAGGIVMGAQIACQQTFVAVGQSICSLILALLRKVILLIPLIYILPAVLQDQVFAVFLAEPVADVLAATATVLLFAFQFKRIWKGKKALAGQGTASV